MTWLPRLIATDLDGTLVRSDNTVSAHSHDVLKRLSDNGVVLVGITGRGPRLLQLCRADMPSADYLVMAQGGYVFECRDDGQAVTLKESAMPGAVAQKVIDLMEATVGPLTVIAENGPEHEAPLLGAVVDDWPFPVPILATSRQDMFASPVIKTFARSESVPALELLRIARQVVPEELCSLTEAGIGYVEICPPHTSKATGLSFVAARLGVSADEVLVFGDATNDLPMFQWASHAVAMPHATADVKAASTDTTIGNDVDGVAVYLEKLFGI